MILVVNDASILIDLLKINLLERFLGLHQDMHTTDLVGAEITDDNAEKFRQYIKKKLINIHSLTDEEWEEVVYIKTGNPRLSMADCSCFWLCQELSATLLTSDGKLR